MSEEQIQELSASLAELHRKVDALLATGPSAAAAPPEHYTTEEFAVAAGRSIHTVRAWCLNERIHATKANSGHGAYLEWRISHEELLRWRREGLLPQRRKQSATRMRDTHATV